MEKTAITALKLGCQSPFLLDRRVVVLEVFVSARQPSNYLFRPYESKEAAGKRLGGRATSRERARAVGEEEHAD